MGYYTKVKKDFSFRKIKFKGIECYEGDGNSIRVTVTGTAQMIRQILKNQYPKYNAEGTWVKTRKFANGDAIDVYLNRFPEDVYKAIKADLDVFDSYAVNHQNAQRVEIKTDDGLPIDANTKYLHIDNVPPYGSKERNEAAPDWEKILKGSAKEKTATPNESSKFSKGELLRECAGWAIYKKTLPDGRIVYSAFKNKETAPNKTDWNTIKSEVYMQSGFKYGRFGNFEKWGSMTANDENLILNALCEVLTKYYGSTTPTTNDEPVDVYINGEFYKQFKNKDESVWSMGAKYGGTKWNELIKNGKAIFSGNVWQINEKEEPTTNESFDIYLDGKFFQKANSQDNAAEIMSNEFGASTFGEMALSGLVRFDNKEKKLWVFKYNFEYGKKLGVPKEYGNLLQLYLAEKGFKIYVSAAVRLVIYKTSMANDGIIIGDFNGDFNLTQYGDYSKIVGSVNYLINKNPISPETLADLIANMYDNYFPNNKEDEPKEEPFKVNDSYRSLPANPKLDYCKITGAEGFIDYSESFPVTFQSFTALTKYIADNIGEIPTQGYDKHFVEWKWKFEDDAAKDRWDVSETEANPIKYPNLYAGEKMRSLCFRAWAKLDEGGLDDASLAADDEFFGVLVGKEGFELSTDQFNTMLTDYLTYYKKDEDKRFAYTKPEDRLNRFKQVYPKIIAAFEEQPIDKEKLKKAIAGLEILAAKGNEKAKKAIIGLQYLLNKN